MEPDGYACIMFNFIMLIRKLLADVTKEINGFFKTGKHFRIELSGVVFPHYLYDLAFAVSGFIWPF